MERISSRKSQAIPDLQKLKAIADFLDAELSLPTQKSLPNEVLTILDIIEHISDENHEDAGGGYLEEPIPEEKIYTLCGSRRLSSMRTMMAI